MSDKKTIKGFKAFDRNLRCRGFQFEEGGEYEIDGSPILCGRGFHFCKDLVLTLAYYRVTKITDNRYAEIEALGDVQFEEPTQHKGVTNKIKILRVLSDEEVLALVDKSNNSGNNNSGDHNSGNCNSGDCNSGDCNSGDCNSGDRNSGDHNSGDRNSGNCNSGDCNSGDRNSGNCNSGDHNSGDRNSGDHNSCDNESGHFNSSPPEYIRVFNKPCAKAEWAKAVKPRFIFFEIKEGEIYKEAFIRSYNDADPEDRELIKQLPNFDAQVFFEISGIDLR